MKQLCDSAVDRGNHAPWGGCFHGRKPDAIGDRFPIAIDLEVLLHLFGRLNGLGGEINSQRIAPPTAHQEPL
jgi:hypothetical protein